MATTIVASIVFAVIALELCAHRAVAVGLVRSFVPRENSMPNANAQAVSAAAVDVGAGMWQKAGPITYTNPEQLLGGQTHKPWVAMEPHRPSLPAVIDGQFWLFTVSFRDGHKCIQAATSRELQGPWNLLEEPVLVVGDKHDFDGYHVDTATAYWFPSRGEMLLFYKGYPARPQPLQPDSPWGSSLGAAIFKPGEARARKIGKLLAPSSQAGHWQAGWVSGIQLVPAVDGGWWGLMSGSPTPPAPIHEEPDMREPAPSLGGWARTKESWPVAGWTVEPNPIVRINDLPDEAKRGGMRVNLWRHHLLVAASGFYLFCNAGSYGREQMFVRTANPPPNPDDTPSGVALTDEELTLRARKLEPESRR